jgi:acetyl-CoA synthetase
MRGDTSPDRGAAHPRAALIDDDPASRALLWEQARDELSSLSGGRGLNIAHEAVDRHAAGPRAGVTALRWVGKRARSSTSVTRSCET